MVTNYLKKNDSFVPAGVPRNKIMENLKYTVNEYVGKFLKKLSSENGYYFQCQLCPHKFAEKKSGKMEKLVQNWGGVVAEFSLWPLPLPTSIIQTNSEVSNWNSPPLEKYTTCLTILDSDISA